MKLAHVSSLLQILTQARVISLLLSLKEQYVHYAHPLQELHVSSLSTCPTCPCPGELVMELKRLSFATVMPIRETGGDGSLEP